MSLPLRAIAITHRQFSTETIGMFHLPEELRRDQLRMLKETLGLGELMYLSTCNRVEFIFTTSHYVCPGFTAKLLGLFRPELSEESVIDYSSRCERYNEVEAAEHLLRLSSSLDSAVIGEPEIITQFRKAFEESRAFGLSADVIRLAVKQCILTAKEVFTSTELSRKPVSAVSVAWREFQTHGLRRDARIILVGAGQVIRNFSKFLAEQGYSRVLLVNRHSGHGEELALTMGFEFKPLSALPNHSGGFDALITCTSSDEPIITSAIFNNLLAGETDEKLVVDLAVPADVAADSTNLPNVRYIGMQSIIERSAGNLEARMEALAMCEPMIRQGRESMEKLWQQRHLEMAMAHIPEIIKEIRATAIGEVFARDLERLDADSRELVERIFAYMEKKYISVPMKMAREVLTDVIQKN